MVVDIKNKRIHSIDSVDRTREVRATYMLSMMIQLGI